MTQNVSSVAAQIYQNFPRDVSTPPPLGMLSAPSAVCKDGTNQITGDTNLPNESHVKVFLTPIQADTSGQITGWCDHYEWGVFKYSERRDINTITIELKSPSGAWTYNPLFQFPSSQSMDTRLGTLPWPVSFGVSEEGEHFSKFTTHGMTTACSIVPTSSTPTQKTLNAVSCLPTWVQKDGAPYLTAFPQDGTPLRIVYSVGLDGPVSTAMAAWKTALVAAGRTNFDYELVLNQPGGDGCGTTANCVRVGFDMLTCAGEDACGCSQGGTRSGGVYTSPGLISLASDWDNNMKAWIIGHELGHLFGLHHASTCADDTTVMKTALCTSTTLRTATASDAVPVSKAVYGSGPTKTCGW
jgi:hypothetical protein